MAEDRKGNKDEDRRDDTNTAPGEKRHGSTKGEKQRLTMINCSTKSHTN